MEWKIVKYTLLSYSTLVLRIKMSLKMHFFRILTYSETSHGLTCACASALRDAKSPKMASQKRVVLSMHVTEMDRPYSSIVLGGPLPCSNAPCSKRSCIVAKVKYFFRIRKKMQKLLINS